MVKLPTRRFPLARRDAGLVDVTREYNQTVTYFTLRVNEDGSISTFGDLYGHDARMAAALFGTRDGFNAQADAGQLSSSQEAPRVKRPRGSGRRGSPLSGFLSN